MELLFRKHKKLVIATLAALSILIYLTLFIVIFRLFGICNGCGKFGFVRQEELFGYATKLCNDCGWGSFFGW